MKELNLKYFFILLGFFLFFINGNAFAIEDTANDVNKSKINLSSSAEKKYITKINFDDICEKAKEHSYDLKIADYNILISKTGIVGARSEYFPKLMVSAGTEYTKNYRDIRETTVMAIADSFINPYTRFQSVMGVTLSYNLFDFGVRKGHLDMAKEDVLIRKLERKEKLQELNLTLVDTYSKIFMLSKQVVLNREILKLEEKNLEYKQRLFEAGELSKTELNDAVVRKETCERRIFELLAILQESINWLSFYTGEEYNIEDLKICAISTPNFDTMQNMDYTKSITWQKKEEELKKKELEIKVAKRANYPKVNAYSRYYLYGSNPNSYNSSLGNIQPSNFTVGGSVSMLAFDGLKNRSNIEKVMLEYKQLQVERDKSIAELMTRLATMRTNLIYIDKQVDLNKKTVKELMEKQKSVKRLVDKKVATPIEENEVAIELLQAQIELEKNSITSNAIVRGIQILTTY
jgi:outer membrane protein TolC